MKQKILILLICILASACNSEDKVKILNEKKSISINENIEWSHTWVANTSKHDLPSVLVVGDSHVEAYYPIVSQKLKGKAYCSKFTTSRCLGDPVLIYQLESVLKAFKFDIISFNNGLHGDKYTEKDYDDAIPVVYQLLKKDNPSLKLIWVNTTARRCKNELNNFDKLNEQVITRNKAISDFTKSKHIPMVDSYSMSYSNPEYFKNDGIHFNKEGVDKESDNLVSEILKEISLLKGESVTK